LVQINNKKNMLKQKINDDYIAAFKKKDNLKKNLLGTIKGEIQNQEKNLMVENLSDEDIIKIITKVSKSIKEMVEKSNGENQKNAIQELEIVQNYLPKQMNEKEIENKIDELINDGISSLGDVMKSFSNLPADKKLVSQIYNSKKK
jgi:uncharacterized protein YqeY